MFTPLDLTGKRFGHWTVEYRDPAPGRFPSGTKRSRWICRCDCGTVKSVSTDSLVRGLSRSTRCRSCVSTVGRERITGNLWSRIKRNADKRGILFKLTKDEAFELFIKQDRCCALSGAAIRLGWTVEQTRHGKCTASLDRIDSDGPYELWNVQWVHKAVNLMKGSLSEADFFVWCQAIVNTTNARFSTSEEA